MSHDAADGLSSRSGLVRVVAGSMAAVIALYFARETKGVDLAELDRADILSR